MIFVKSARELEIMREAGRIVAQTHAEMKKLIAPGITTRELDAAADRVIREAGATPSFKGYHGYPAAICTSVNEELVHGIPGTRRLAEGDIISVDIGAHYRGYHGDSAWTYPVGRVSSEVDELLQVTEESLYEGLRMAVAGNRLLDISHAIQKFVETRGFSIVRDYVGHGIGSDMHEEPQIPNYGPPGKGPRLRPGMALAIEPMVNAGGPEVRTLSDDWTVVTMDGRLCAHFEHTVAIAEQGAARILTLP